ncbi:uncharacterized protein TNIN_76391 [Trichonephila inaurata madagascariensis]|uniref:Protein FAM199X n=1 Tax=Trichonephila inaurata madagascariensis TaxID=2747483 RepID=A0A8X6WZT4_9ARAC|nr:uncharacterized protein TNIN_76391 [Trichonephila inaurata madagascariensis]
MFESSIIGSSAWDSDPVQDYGNKGLFSEYNSNCDDNILGNSYWSGCSTLNDVSSCSSDHDGLVFEELEFFDISDSFVYGILDNNTTSEWFNLEESPPEKEKPVAPFTPDASVKENAVDYLLSTKLWSQMSSHEQLNTLHALSEVAVHMSIREQMEMIKIIDPTAVIAADDKEFTLDSSNLNDVKLQKVKDYIRKQKLLREKSSKSLNSSSLSSKKSNNSSKLVSRKNASYTKTKRKSQKEKQNMSFPAEEKRIKLKRQKQIRKEQKSGFFVYEKKVVIDSVLEDEDINILE